MSSKETNEQQDKEKLAKIEKQKHKLKMQQKYKKPYKQGYLHINKMHLKGNDYMGDLEKMQQEQTEAVATTNKVISKKAATKQFTSPIPPARVRIQRIVEKRLEKAYARFITNKGNINMELFCYLTPKTCDNFISLCQAGKYNNSSFHRVIKGFMAQGGRQYNGSSFSDKSVWGLPFEDEIVPELKHDKRGILSMANAGSNTNGSEFFITFVPCPHLDGKHTVFGRVVGGFGTLDAIEKVETTKGEDKPIDPITIEQVVVYTDPYKIVEQELLAAQ